MGKRGREGSICEAADLRSSDRRPEEGRERCVRAFGSVEPRQPRESERHPFRKNRQAGSIREEIDTHK